jgi:hypothetical protein
MKKLTIIGQGTHEFSDGAEVEIFTVEGAAGVSGITITEPDKEPVEVTGNHWVLTEITDPDPEDE